MNSGKSVQILEKLQYKKEGQGSWENIHSKFNKKHNWQKCRVGENFYSGTELRAPSQVNYFWQCSSNSLPFRGLTWNVATVAVSTDSLHPMAAVGKRLLAGQVKNQAQQRQLTPLWKGRWWVMVWWGGLCRCHMQRTRRRRRVGIKSAYFLFFSLMWQNT